MSKRIINFIWLCAVSISALAQQSETRAMGSFRGVKVSQAIDVFLKKGNKESARIEVTSGLPADVVTELEGNSLRIKMKDMKGFWNKSKVKVYVTYVNLDKLSCSSASSIFSEGIIKTNDIQINASSAANVEISLDANSVLLDVSSAGDALLEGKTQKLEVDASSGADVNVYRLQSETVVVNATSGAGVKVSVTKELDAHASSGGDIRYRGSPARANTNSNSGGSVKKSN